MGEVREDYRNHLIAQGRTIETAQFYIRCAERFTAWCEQSGRCASSASPEDITAYLAFLRGRVGPVTVIHNLSGLRAFYRWLGGDDPTAALRLKHPPLQPQQPFTEDELRRLLLVAEHPRDRALLMVLISSGLRVSEVAGMRTGDIDWRDGIIRVTGKGDKLRVVAPGRGTMRTLRRWVGLRQGWVWPRLDGRNPDRPIKRESLWRIVRYLGELAGVEHVHPHRFRTTYAVMFLAHGGDAGALKESLGHASLTMALHYASYGATQRALDTQRRLSLADRIAG